ncbi:MAG TPA: DPP IV N-terminal domain-containing protein [Gemmatimonadaceae bacterium]
MPVRRSSRSLVLGWSGAAAAALALLSPLHAQDRLKSMPGYEQYDRVGRQIAGSVTSGAIDVEWSEDGRSFDYAFGGKQYRYDVAAKRAVVTGEAPENQGRRGRGRGNRARGNMPDRGRQFATADSPDKTRKAFYRDRNLWVSDADGSHESAITTDGSETARVKYGTASWVYGEELGQRTAMWWSPDSRRLAYYRFDEQPVKDFYLATSLTKVQDTLDVEAYPKAGQPNPIVDLFVYDLTSRTTKKLDIRDGRPFDDDVVGHYVYAISWTKDGRELLIHRTDRRQNVLELAACDPATAKCRTVVHEEWLPSWVDNTPDFRFLEDGRRFIWSSERNGWKNFYLYDLNGTLITPLTTYTQAEASAIVSVDEKNNVFFYTARDGDNPMKLQLHRVGLDGKGDRRLTDPAFTHTLTPSPDAKYFVDVAQTHDTPPTARLIDANGAMLDTIARTDLAKFDQLGLKKVELFTFKAADGRTDLFGMLHVPSNFDPSHRYPLLVTVYAGPATNGARETFTTPNPLTEYGFLVASLDSRSAGGRGKRFLDAIYKKLGTVEIDDQAAGVKALSTRPYVDGARVGIFGTSYGGYASLMALLRYPDVFAAASSSSPVTAWYNYDTIYTERYMWIPQENRDGYENGSAMNLADQLKGRLLLYYGTADNNVHPSNMMQLIAALQKAGKSFDLQVGPDQGHSGVNQQRMMEFFIENLVVRPGASTTLSIQ